MILHHMVAVILLVLADLYQLVDTQACTNEGQVLENDTDNAATDGSRPPITPLPKYPSGSLETKMENERIRFRERKINKLIALYIGVLQKYKVS